jgi:hypothetical protein
MTYVILAGPSLGKRLEQAAEHLRNRGHRVDITGDADQILFLATKEHPDVVALSSPLHDRPAYDLAEEFKTQFPDAGTQFIWIAPLDNHTGEPIVVWANLQYANILTFPPSEWDIVLAVEQLLFRSVGCDMSQQAFSVLQQLVNMFLRYLKKKQGQFPSMADFSAVDDALVSEYKFLKGQLHHPQPARQFCPNSALSERSWQSLESSAPVILFYEEPALQDGTRWVAFLEGKLGQLRPRFERVSAEEWQRLKPTT